MTKNPNAVALGKLKLGTKERRSEKKIKTSSLNLVRARIAALRKRNEMKRQMWNQPQKP